MIASKLPAYNSLDAILLSHQDSNLDKQIQRLVCYHYTMGQFGTAKLHIFLYLQNEL